jgi:hypothetical protein
MTNKITIGKHVVGAGDLNAAIGERVVACAFLREGGPIAVHDIVRGGEPIITADPGEAYDVMDAIATREAAIEELKWIDEAAEAGWGQAPDGRWWREPREGESIPAERLETFLGSGPFLWAESAEDAVALDATIAAMAELERPGGCGAAIYWTARSVNDKTGPIPVTTTSAESCSPTCPLLKAGCYAKHGPVGMLWSALTKHGPNAAWQHGRGVARSIDWKGLCERVAALAEGTLWRHNQAGDLPHRGQRITLKAFRALVKANRGRRGFTYTHHNVTEGAIGEHNRRAVRAANKAGFTINLSANNLAHADKLADQGCGPVTVVTAPDAPRTTATPRGRTVRGCPATYSDVTCNKCQWCALPYRRWIVGFPAHGSQARAAAEIAQSST